jgi:hypothetical protein
MSHELETINGVTSFAFAGERQNIWHRLGQQFDGGLMTADEAMSQANMDRDLRFIECPAPEGVQWGIDQPFQAILDGKVGVTSDGDLFEIPQKIVGMGGEQWKLGHEALTVRDRFELAEAAIHVSKGEAVWSTAGYIRNATQGFATMEAPPIVIDPNGVADIFRRYQTVTWSFDSSLKTLLSASEIRVVCANTQGAHLASKTDVIAVKMTSGSYDRMAVAADHWAMAQDSAKALMLQGERMLAIPNGKQVLKGLCEEVLGLDIPKDASKRTRTIRENKLDEIRALYHAPTNLQAVGDNGYAAYQTVLEYFDWFSPVKGEDAITERVANQFDGTYDNVKARAAEYVLSFAQ